MTPAELYDALARLQWESAGTSWLGRPIYVRTFAGRSAAPPVFLCGAVHGDEPLGVYCLLRLAAELAAGVPDDLRTAFVVPVVNPDGLLAASKNNARGVDLNRNFPAANWAREHRPNYDPGAAPGSEPETQALLALVARSQARRIIALHSPFRTVNYDGPARSVAERMAERNGYGATADIGYPTPGSMGSYYGVDLQLEVVTLEIPPMDEEIAWRENREALYAALERDVF